MRIGYKNTARSVTKFRGLLTSLPFKNVHYNVRAVRSCLTRIKEGNKRLTWEQKSVLIAEVNPTFRISFLLCVIGELEVLVGDLDNLGHLALCKCYWMKR